MHNGSTITERPIPGIPGYTISADGRVRNTKTGHTRSTPTDRHGYATLYVRLGGKNRAFLVHRLVLRTFAGEPPTPRAVARHLNGVRADNRIQNLAWGTQAENIADAIRHGTAHQIGRRGEEGNSAKLTEAEVREIEERANAGAESMCAIARAFDISPRHVGQIRDRKVWKHLW